MAQKEPRIAQTLAAGNKRDTPKGFTRGIAWRGWDFIWLYRNSQFLPLVFFSFSESRTAFSFANKRKSGFTRKGYAPSVRRRSRQRLGCGPSRAGKKTNCKIKTSHFSHKRKSGFTRKEYTPAGQHPPTPSENHHPGGVDTNGRGTVFHPLNGSGARGTAGRSNPRRRR